MSNWFSGVIEGAYVGTPAKVTAKGTLEVAPYDIRLYRGSISAIKRIPPPDDDPPEADSGATPEDTLDDPSADPTAASPDPATIPDSAPTDADGPGSRAAAPTQVPKAPATTQPAAPGGEPSAPRELRQAELTEVTFLGVGAEDARDEHAAYDLRITDVRLLDSTESEGQIYGRLTGRVVGCLTPSSRMVREAEHDQRAKKKRDGRIGTWVEALRWVMIALATWLAFGLCGSTAGTLWLAVVLPCALLRLITGGVVSASHGTRVFGWAVVLASASLGGLMFYRVLRIECESTLWWLAGMVVAVVASSILPSRYPFFWTKALLATTVVSLCGLGDSTCKQQGDLPSVVSQGPRTNPDGSWPRDPDLLGAQLSESRPLPRPMSLSNALSQGADVWLAVPPRVVMLPIPSLLTETGEVNTQSESARRLLELLRRFKDARVTLEVHGPDELSRAQAQLLEAWLASEADLSQRTRVLAAGEAFPLVPGDAPEGLDAANRRIEVTLSMQ